MGKLIIIRQTRNISERHLLIRIVLARTRGWGPERILGYEGIRAQQLRAAGFTKQNTTHLIPVLEIFFQMYLPVFFPRSETLIPLHEGPVSFSSLCLNRGPPPIPFRSPQYKSNHKKCRQAHENKSNLNFSPRYMPMFVPRSATLTRAIKVHCPLWRQCPNRVPVPDPFQKVQIETKSKKKRKPARGRMKKIDERPKLNPIPRAQKMCHMQSRARVSSVDFYWSRVQGVILWGVENH